VNKYEFPLSGSKTFEFSLQSTDTGEFVIPSVQLTYFDAGSASYKTAATAPVHYTVVPGVRASTTDPAQDAAVQKKELPGYYFYFGIVALGIIGWIIYQIRKSRQEKTT